jgi:hypothetical protein
VGSAASQFLLIKREVRGIEISANHLSIHLKESLRVLHELFTKNAASVGNKITDEEEFDFALQVD